MNPEERNKVIELCNRHRTGKYITYEDHMFLQKMLHSYKKEYEEIFDSLSLDHKLTIIYQKKRIDDLIHENNECHNLLDLYQSKVTDLEARIKYLEYCLTVSHIQYT